MVWPFLNNLICFLLSIFTKWNLRLLLKLASDHSKEKAILEGKRLGWWDPASMVYLWKDLAFILEIRVPQVVSGTFDTRVVGWVGEWLEGKKGWVGEGSIVYVRKISPLFSRSESRKSSVAHLTYSRCWLSWWVTGDPHVKYEVHQYEQACISLLLASSP